MKERLYRALNIKHSESSQVFDLLTVQFFIGLGNALINIIAFTLFVYNFPIQSLPLVYLVIAGVLIVLNFVYEKLEHSFSPLQVLRYVIGFSAVLLVVMWVGITYFNKNDFIFALLVSSVLIYMLVGYAFWGLVSLLFNVRESRRVFSIVGSGDIPAKLIGYIAAPLLIPFVGLSNIIWLAVFSLVTGFFLFGKYTKKKNWDALRHKSHADHHHKEKTSKEQGIVSFFFKSKLIFAISLLSILSYNVFVLVDFTFISQVKLRYEKINDLALYIAVFFAFGRIIAMAFKLIFTSRVIERLGVIYCLFLTPAALLLFCLIFLVFGVNDTYNIYIFGVMAMLTEVLRSTMQEPVFFILFQPLKENLRLKGHMISKGYMYPPSLLVVGLSLLFFYRTGIDVSIMLSVKIVLLNLCIWAGVIFLIRKTYLNAIHTSIKKGIFSTDEIYITDTKAIDILLKKIEAGNRIDVIYALDLLEKSGYAGLVDLLDRQLEYGKDVAIQKYALERLETLGKVQVATLHQMLPAIKDIELEQKVISLLCRFDPGYLKKVSEEINSHDYSKRKIIIISLLNQFEFDYLLKAGNEMNRLMHSALPEERELALEIIAELKHVHFSDALGELVNDEEISVKRLAVLTACKLRMTNLLPSMVDMLSQPAQKNIAIKGLQVYGDTLFEDIRTLKIAIPHGHLSDFVKMAGRIKGPHSTSFLISKLDDDSIIQKDRIVHALWLKEYHPDGNVEKEKLAAVLHHYLKTGIDKEKDYNSIPDFTHKDLLSRSVFTEVKNDLIVALKACSLLYVKKEINRVLELLESDKHDKIYNAMEMLELVLPKRISKEINLLFDFILDPLHHSRIGTKHEARTLLNKIFFNSHSIYNPWTKAVCIYSSWKNRETEFLDKLKAHDDKKEHYLVRETKIHVLDSINQ